jgi:hypothetical protein
MTYMLCHNIHTYIRVCIYILLIHAYCAIIHIHTHMHTYIHTPTSHRDNYYMHISGKTSREHPLLGVQQSDKNTTNTTTNNNNNTNDNNRQSRGSPESRTTTKTKSILKEKGNDGADSSATCVPRVTVVMRPLCADGPLCVDTIECEMYCHSHNN